MCNIFILNSILLIKNIVIGINNEKINICDFVKNVIEKITAEIIRFLISKYFKYKKN